MKLFRIAILLLFVSSFVPAQIKIKNSSSIFPSSVSVLDSLTQSYERIEDYYVQIELSIKTPVLRMPRKRVDFWYKKPNLTKAETKGFAAIPKSGLVSSPLELFDNLSDLTVIGAEYYRGKQVWILLGELHPDSLMFKNMGNVENTPNLSMRLFVDRENWVLIKSETWMDTMKIIEIESDYTFVSNEVYLPKETTISFEYSGDLTSGIENSFHSDNQIVNMKKDMIMNSETTEKLKNKKFSGFITLKFSKYIVNQGLDDSFFEEERVTE